MCDQTPLHARTQHQNAEASQLVRATQPQHTACYKLLCIACTRCYRSTHHSLQPADLGVAGVVAGLVQALVLHRAIRRGWGSTQRLNWQCKAVLGTCSRHESSRMRHNEAECLSASAWQMQCAEGMCEAEHVGAPARP